MENQDEIKIAKIKNLNKLNWSTNMNILIDANVNIGNILSIESYTYDEKIECGNEHASIVGKIGVKVVYIDTDNIPNTLFDSIPFNEVCQDKDITANSNIMLNETCVTASIISTDGMLKLGLDCTLGLMMYSNTPLATSIGDFEGLVIKKSNISTFLLDKTLNTSFEYSSTIETEDKIEKILTCSSCFTPTNVVPDENLMTIEGKLMSIVTYETQSDEGLVIKQQSSIDSIKLDLAVDGLTKDDYTNIIFSVDHNNQQLSTSQDEINEINITNTIRVSGVILRPIVIDVIDDLYSCQNQIETSSSTCVYLSSLCNNYSSDRITCDKVVSSDEGQVEAVVGCTNLQLTVTQKYIKEDSLCFEGIATCYVIYQDENKKYKNTYVESPFIIDTKKTCQDPNCVDYQLSCTNVEAKTKHADTIIVEFDIAIAFVDATRSSREIIDNVVIGKPIDYDNIDYQIFIARPNETKWDICKRMKSDVEDVLKFNKDLPETMLGGEKIVIKR